MGIKVGVDRRESQKDRLVVRSELWHPARQMPLLELGNSGESRLWRWHFHPVIPAFRKLKQEDCKAQAWLVLHEFKASLN